MDWIKAHKKWVLITVLVVAALAIGGSFIEDEPAESHTEDEVEMTPVEKIESIITDRLGDRVKELDLGDGEAPYIVTVMFEADRSKTENDKDTYAVMKELNATGYEFQAINMLGSLGALPVYKAQLTRETSQAVDWSRRDSLLDNLNFYWWAEKVLY